MSKNLKVVCDWDYPYPGKKYALKMSFRYFVYFLSRYLSFLRKYCEDIYQENKNWIQVYSELEDLTGKKMIYGIRPDSKEKFSEFVSGMKKDKRLHLHMWFEKDRELFKKIYGYEGTGHRVSWVPKITEDLVDPDKTFLDFRLKESDLKKVMKSDMVVFHPDYKEKSLLLYLKLLKMMRGRKK